MNGGSEFCQIFMSHCFPPLAGRSAGPEGIEPCAGCGPVMAVVLSAGPALNVHTIWTGSDAVVFLRPEWPVGVERGSYNDITAAGRWWYNTYVYRADDLLVEAQEVEPPYTLAVSDTVFRPFRAIWATLHGSQADAAILSYMFVPGDTAAEPQSWGTDPRFTPKYIQCRDAACPVYPDAPGRIYAWVRHQNHDGLIVGPVLRPARSSSSARLVLTCKGDLPSPNRVTRGEQVTCTASKNPRDAAGELKITGWTFEGRARTDGDVTSTEWRGIIVKPGTVQVSGTIGGVAVTDSAQLAVKAREWSGYVLTQRPDTQIVLLPGTSAFPQTGTRLGTFTLRLLSEDAITSATDSIGAGPNAGFLFLLRAPNLDGVGADITLHPALYPPPPGAPWSDPEYERWYKDQNRRGSGTCDVGVVGRLRQGVERHEGVTLAAESHLGIANKAFRELRPQSDLEKWTVANRPRSIAIGEIHDLWQAFRDSRLKPKQDAFDREDYPQVYGPEVLGCVLDINPGDN